MTLAVDFYDFKEFYRGLPGRAKHNFKRNANYHGVLSKKSRKY